MAPFMLGESSSHSPRSMYDLYATVNHYGAVYMGHYIAQVKPACPGQKGEQARTECSQEPAQKGGLRQG